MTEHTVSTWRTAIGSWLRNFLKPLLLLAVGAGLIVALGAAQRLGWVTAGGGGGGGGGDQATAPAPEEETSWICPMMCTPPMEEPGRCPVCGMELVPASSGNGDDDGASIQIDSASRRVANIQTAAARAKAVKRRIRAVGKINYDEGKLKTLSAYVDGRIDQLYADYTGMVVNQGDNLALLYSPKLYTAQSELLSALRGSGKTSSSLYSGILNPKSLLESSRQKLIDLGMTDNQIQRIESTGKPVTRIELVAPIHGTVIDRLAAEGEYVKTGQPIYRLADLSTVWLMLELFPRDAAAIRYGQRVEAKVDSLPGEVFTGRVAFVDPTVNPRTRTIGVRVVMENEDGRLKVGDYATATIQAPIVTAGGRESVIYDPRLAGKWISPRHPHVIEDGPGHCEICGIELVPASRLGFTSDPVADRRELVVPRNAVLVAGDNSVVYVEAEPGRFELRRVRLGPSMGDEIVLLDGVKAGEEVATNGNFLIDSEMQLSNNPSLIDPIKTAGKSSPDHDHEHDHDFDTPEIKAALAELSEEDGRLAREQRICPVTEAPLGSMGTPKKVDVGDHAVFICCEGCREPLLDNPDKHLAVLEAARGGRRPRMENKPQEVISPPDPPPAGSIELLDDEPPDPGDSNGPAPPVGSVEVMEVPQ
ncbi:MAG: efflux RND transporter periplasmic adaptor subunit [Planctomycetota bacterium]